MLLAETMTDVPDWESITLVVVVCVLGCIIVCLSCPALEQCCIRCWTRPERETSLRDAHQRNRGMLNETLRSELRVDVLPHEVW